MKIILHAIMGIKDAIGQRITEVEIPPGSTVSDLLAYMKEKWGDKLSTRLFDPLNGELLSHIRILVNGQAINFLEGLGTSLKEGDEVLVLPPVSGGQGRV